MSLASHLSLRSKLHGGLALMFLTVAGIAAVTMVLVKRNLEATERMTAHVTPTAQASLQMLGGLNHSMAALRGWMLLGEAGFLTERRAAIDEEIVPAFAELRTRSLGGLAGDRAPDLDRIETLLGEVLSHQQAIEDIAQTPENVPALKLLVEEAAPVTFLMADSLRHLIDMERRREADPSRQDLLFILAHTHGSTNNASANLRDYLLTGEERYRQAWSSEWMRSGTRFQELCVMDFLLTEEQKAILETHREARERFGKLAAELVELRTRPDWNVANHWMGTRAAPVTEELATQLHTLVAGQSELLERTANEIWRNTRNLTTSAWLLMGFAFAVTLVLAHMVVRGVAGPLIQLRGAMARIQQAGDLGRPIEISLNPRDEIGAVVTEFNRMAAELRRTSVSKTYVENILGSMNDALAVLEPDGTVRYANRSMEQWLGASEGEVEARRFKELVRLGGGQSYTGWLAEVHRSGMVPGVDAEFLRKDGTTLPVSLSAALLRDAGASVGIVCVAQDMQERMQLQQRMREAKEAAESANHAKSDFLARMSHEIRTPMNGVIGMAELLAETELNELQRRFVANVLRSAESLLGIINDILDFSKIEAGKLELDDAPFDLRQLIDETTELFSERAQRSGVELLCGIAPAVRTALRGDPNRLRQVLINLLGNAFKFTEAGEVAVRVTTESETAGHVQLRFEVRDTGPGIVPEARERIFESFAQADGSITRRYGGTGLGLAICRRLVELMAGRIGVDSVPGEGATFWFTATFATEAGVVSDRPDPGHVLRGLNVLVVDDNATNRAILHEQLAAWRVPHETADGYETALALHRAAAAAGRPFGLGLFDKDMPGGDGLDLARAVRDDLPGARFPIVILSSLWRELSREEMEALGIRAYLTKPVRQSQLYNALVAITRREGQPQPTVGLAPVPPSVRFDGRGCRILLVEDNPVNQELGCEMLRSLGCMVEVAEDGAKALEAVEQGGYAAVLMDCQMPAMDGFEATRRLRDAEQAKGSVRLPVVALTANALQGDRERCIAAGMDDYLSKPFTLAQLAQVLGRWVPAGESGDAVTTSEPPAVSPVLQGAGLAEPCLDPQALDAVRALQRPGAPDMVSRIVGLYLESAAKLVPVLREAAATGDGPAVRAAAHSLKSASANVGAMRLSVMCKELEGLAREGSLATAQAKAATIATEFDAVALTLAAAMGREAASREAAA